MMGQYTYYSPILQHSSYNSYILCQIAPLLPSNTFYCPLSYTLCHILYDCMCSCLQFPFLLHLKQRSCVLSLHLFSLSPSSTVRILFVDVFRLSQVLDLGDPRPKCFRALLFIILIERCLLFGVLLMWSSLCFFSFSILCFRLLR